MPYKVTAHTLLLLIRCSRNPDLHPVSAKSEVRQALWDASALDCAGEDDGRLAVPSKKVVCQQRFSHRLSAL